MTELKPCPFCGSTNVEIRRKTWNGDEYFYIHCENCEMDCRKSDWANGFDKSNIEEQWNRRVKE